MRLNMLWLRGFKQMIAYPRISGGISVRDSRDLRYKFLGNALDGCRNEMLLLNGHHYPVSITQYIPSPREDS